MNIEPYECINYNSCITGAAFDYVYSLIHKESQECKFVLASEKPRCVHALGAIPKSNGSTDLCV